MRPSGGRPAAIVSGSTQATLKSLAQDCLSDDHRSERATLRRPPSRARNAARARGRRTNPCSLRARNRRHGQVGAARGVRHARAQAMESPWSRSTAGWSSRPSAASSPPSGSTTSNRSRRASTAPAVLTLDHYEVFRLMDTWLRQVLVPALPDGVEPRDERPRATGRRLVRARGLPDASARPARGSRFNLVARARRCLLGGSLSPEPDRPGASARAHARLGRRLRAS